MGGLDARQLLASPAWSGRILSLTTIGTPHLGSALADWSRLRVGPVYRLLRTMRIDHRGFLDLTRRAAGAVNRNGFDDQGVPCFCVAGDPEVDLVCWPLKRFHDVLAELEGPNDGLVSVASAQGFGTPLPTWPVDHLRQLNWLSPTTGPSSSGRDQPAVRHAGREPRRPRLRREGSPGRSIGSTNDAADRPSKAFGKVFLLDPLLRSLVPAVRSRSTATVMSPRTLEVVRQRSRNQSMVSRTGILSAGSPTAAKIRGRVTKLPDGMPPAPTLATSVVTTMITWSTGPRWKPIACAMNSAAVAW